MQQLEVFLQIRCIRFRGLSVDSHCAVFARAPVGFTQPFYVDMVGERLKCHLGAFSRLFCYPFEFQFFAERKEVEEVGKSWSPHCASRFGRILGHSNTGF
jgi:hypothetical protein